METGLSGTRTNSPVTETLNPAALSLPSTLSVMETVLLRVLSSTSSSRVPQKFHGLDSSALFCRPTRLLETLLAEMLSPEQEVPDRLPARAKLLDLAARSMVRAFVPLV